jgi:signal transduction histidine kinase
MLGRGLPTAAVLAATLFAAGPARAGAAPAAIAGSLRVHLCAAADCERPPDTAPGWRAYPLGARGIAGPLDHHEGVGWAILSFALPAGLETPAEPALLLTSPADAEVATLNGVPAGGEGVIAARYLAVPGGPRLLELPRGALRAGSNELALKVLFAEKNAEAFAGPLLLGERDRIALECELLRRPLIASEAAFMGLFLVMIVLFAFLIGRGVVRSDYVLFSAFLLLYTAGFVLESHLVYFSGLASPGTEQLQAVLRRVLTLVVLALVTTVTGNRFGRAFALFAAAAATLLGLQVLLPPLQSLHLLALPRKALLGVLAAWYLFLAARAIQRRRPDAVPAFVGVAAYAAGSRLDLYWGIAARDYGTGAFALAMLFTITSRHARLRARIEEISARLLDAHEEERRRIARDIHDGIGQSLLALRLKVQVLAARGGAFPPPAGDALPALAEEAGTIVNELRRTILDLRPPITETPELAPAIRGYAAAVAAQCGLELHFHEGRQPPPALPERTRRHLFRIFQELLTNVQRHAGATRVDVSLHRDGSRLVLQVSDDGRGFAPGDGGGIGLDTMRERAELLGGTLSIESAPARGTAVTVEIPLP